MSTISETENEIEAAQAQLQSHEPGAPVGQLGVLRYVQLVYFALWVLLSWLLIKVGGGFWEELYESFDSVPEPNSIILSVSCAAIAFAVTVALYRSEKVHTFVSDVCIELTKVSWPTRQETWSQTIVVLIVSAIAAVILGTFDVLWSAITDLVYGA